MLSGAGQGGAGGSELHPLLGFLQSGGGDTVLSGEDSSWRLFSFHFTQAAGRFQLFAKTPRWPALTLRDDEIEMR